MLNGSWNKQAGGSSLTGPSASTHKPLIELTNSEVQALARLGYEPVDVSVPLQIIANNGSPSGGAGGPSESAVSREPGKDRA